MRGRGRRSQIRTGRSGRSTLARRGAQMSSLWRRLLGRDREQNSSNAGSLSLRLEPESRGSVMAEPTLQVTAEKDVVSSIQSFGMDLLRQECASRARENVFISPLS